MTDPIPPKGDRIAKVLSRAGIASRRDAEALIADGRVSVNGKRIDSPALTVTDRDRIAVDGKPVGPPEPPRLWLYHKPTGVVTTARDEKGRPTIFDALPTDMPRVMSIGRLDLNSEGLLILTNDGAVKRRLELPSTGWLRRYRVRINGSVSEENLDRLRRGITVEDTRFMPMEVTFDRQQGANAWLTISLREGKNREIRRAMGEIGVTVNRLIRVSYGPFQLGNLAAGEVEELKSRVVRDQLGLDARPQPQRLRPSKPVGTAADKAGRTGPPKPGGKPGARPYVAKSGDKPAPRSAGFKSHGGSTGDGPARSAGFKSHGANKGDGTTRSAGTKSQSANKSDASRSTSFKSHGANKGDGPARSAGTKSHGASKGDRPARPRAAGPTSVRPGSAPRGPRKPG